MDTNDIIVTSNDGTKTAESSKPASAQDAVEHEVTEKVQPEESESTTENEVEDTEDNEQDEADSQDESDTESSKPKRKSGAQRNKEKLARLEQEIARLQGQISERAGAKPPAETPKQAASNEEPGKPDPGQFETHAEYIEAVTEWKLDQRERAREEKARAEKQKEQIDSSVSSFQAKAKEFAEKTKDFSDVLEDVNDIAMSPHMQQFFLEAENGPELMYELAKNRDEYSRINALSPYRAGLELGKIASRLDESAKAKATPKQITKSKAPPPITPVAGNSQATKSFEQLSADEMVDWYRGQRKKK